MGRKHRAYLGLIWVLSTGLQAEGSYRCQNGLSVTFQNTPCLGAGGALNPLPAIGMPNNPDPTRVIPAISDPSLASPGLVLKKSADGHFHAQAAVNGFNIDFLVDTGASMIAIPRKYASAANLGTELELQTSTAAGQSQVFSTTITQLDVGPFHASNVAAVLIQGDTALLGMSFLSQFDLSQKGNVLILSRPSP